MLKIHKYFENIFRLFVKKKDLGQVVDFEGILSFLEFM